MDQIKPKEPALDLASELNLEYRYRIRRNQMKASEMIAVAQENHSKTQELKIIPEDESQIITLPTWLVLLLGLLIGIMIGVILSSTADIPSLML